MGQLPLEIVNFARAHVYAAGEISFSDGTGSGHLLTQFERLNGRAILKQVTMEITFITQCTTLFRTENSNASI
jgi:hypothetical protein